MTQLKTIRKTKGSAADEVEEALVRTGVNKSLYISKPADGLLTKIKAASRRSKSMIVSLLLEKYGPEVLRDPKAL